jgi:mono/diheme cytochrome c family protein
MTLRALVILLLAAALAGCGPYNDRWTDSGQFLGPPASPGGTPVPIDEEHLAGNQINPGGPSPAPPGLASPGAGGAAGPPPGKPGEPFAVAAVGMPGYEEVEKMTLVSGNPARGQAIYKEKCASCHGEAGKGDGPGGAALNPRPRDLTDPAGYKYGADAKGIVRTDMHGVPGTGMVALGMDKEQDYWDVAAYILSLQKK